jgi:hypothetical protein
VQFVTVAWRGVGSGTSDIAAGAESRLAIAQPRGE